MPIVTTLNFSGRTEEALNYYQKTLDAEIVFLMRFSESPDQSHTIPGMENMIFHTTFRIEDTLFMASDVGYSKETDPTPFSGFSLALRFTSVDKAKRIFGELSSSGKIIVPLTESKFTSWYGIVVDPFGISWKINVDQTNGQSAS